METQHSHHGDEAHDGPGVRTYLAIGLVLAVLTWIEVQLPAWLAADRPLLITSLLVTAFGKAGLVMMFYMHLRHDSRVFTGVVVLSLGLVAYFLWLLLL
jgi:heme/copper-type cytochrome/quinol oxidase subunit 4